MSSLRHPCPVSAVAIRFLSVVFEFSAALEAGGERERSSL